VRPSRIGFLSVQDRLPTLSFGGVLDRLTFCFIVRKENLVSCPRNSRYSYSRGRTVVHRLIRRRYASYL
jgi:hypothetical protein